MEKGKTHSLHETGCMRQGAKVGFARALRREQTLAEKRLWEQLRNRTLDGFKFSRQVPIGPYIADFVCRDQRLIVEVDGATHSTEDELTSDNRRTGFLKSESYNVIRFQNDEIMSGMDEVLTLILQALRNFPRQ
jgi:very-short-patch-repair endonuclease